MGLGDRIRSLTGHQRSTIACRCSHMGHIDESRTVAEQSCKLCQSFRLVQCFKAAQNAKYQCHVTYVAVANLGGYIRGALLRSKVSG